MSDNECIDVSVAQDGGVLKKIIEAAPEGALGPPPNGNEVEAHYTGKSLVSASATSLLCSSFLIFVLTAFDSSE